MNKYEERFRFELGCEHRAGLVTWYGFEAITLKLAADVRYTPDFLVIRPFPEGSRVEVYEVKGHMRDDARVKLRVAASLYPWIQFYLVTNVGGARQIRWNILKVPAGELQPDVVARDTVLAPTLP